MKIKILFIILLFTSTPILAKGSLAISPFISSMDQSSGLIIGITGYKDRLLYKGELNLASNIGGPSLSVGYSFGQIKLYAGYVDVIRMKKIRGLVDVHGVGVIDQEGDGKGSAPFVELIYKNTFIRYTEYTADFYHRATRQTTVEGEAFILEGQNVTNVKGSALLFGLNFLF